MRAVTDGKPLKRSSMAAEIGNPEGKRRRKKPSDRPKLLVNDRVEVKLFSWSLFLLLFFFFFQ